MNRLTLKRFCDSVDEGRTPDDDVIAELYAEFKRQLNKRPGRPTHDMQSATEVIPKLECVGRVLELHEQGYTYTDAYNKVSHETGYRARTIKDWRLKYEDMVISCQRSIYFIKALGTQKLRRFVKDGKQAIKKLKMFGYKVPNDTTIADILRAAKIIECDDVSLSELDKKINDILLSK